jgi:tetratricopeptide (TPR) repeat protein
MLRAMEIFSSPDGSLTDHGGITDCLKTVKETRSCWGVEVLYNTRLFFYLAAGEYEEAVKMMDGRNSHAMSQHRGSVHETFNLYADGLACFAQARRTENSQKAKALIQQARDCMRLLKLLSRSNPAVSFGKAVLLEAENAAIEKKYTLAEEKYNHAASLAKKYGSNFELAFSKQTAGEYFFYDRKDKNRAISCFEEAIVAYEAWEGKAAVTHLNRRIGLLRAS